MRSSRSLGAAGNYPEIRRSGLTRDGAAAAVANHLEVAPDTMMIRRRTVEHPLGTLKSWIGATHFLTKGLEKVRTEMSLHVLAYNLGRLIAILGVHSLIEVLRAEQPRSRRSTKTLHHERARRRSPEDAPAVSDRLRLRTGSG